MVKSIRAACSSAHRSTHLGKQRQRAKGERRLLLPAVGGKRQVCRRRPNDKLVKNVTGSQRNFPSQSHQHMGRSREALKVCVNSSLKLLDELLDEGMLVK